MKRKRHKQRKLNMMYNRERKRIVRHFGIVLMLWPETVISKDGFYPPDAPNVHGICIIKPGA